MKTPGKKTFFTLLGDVFAPMIPAFIAAGVCAGVAALLSGCSQPSFGYSLAVFLKMINNAFNVYLSAWVGYNAALAFGGTPVMGGIIGMASILPEVDVIASMFGLSGYLTSGSGGAVAVIGGVFLMCTLEKTFNKFIPKDLRQVFCPFFSTVISMIPFLFIIMPLMGFLTGLLSKGVIFLCSNNSTVIRMITGYVCSMFFLPAQLFGFQPAFTTIYILQLETQGFVSLSPMLSTAGASQVGVAIAVFLKCRKVKNTELASTCISGAIPGVLGVGNALIYGMSVPYPKTFVATCLGAGIGGAFVALMQVYATGWGPSGILAIPLMTAGVSSPIMNMVHFTLGLLLAVVSGFFLACILVKKEYLKENR